MDFFKSYFDLYRIIKIKIVEGYNTTFRSFEKKGGGYHIPVL